ncbi:hypothetical protein [Xanthomonas arboricola]|uniref:phage terminase large subunit family protein n=1 Tax=Xanthomonas arboricola TaxID=56448 RepID=UPI003CF2D726
MRVRRRRRQHLPAGDAAAVHGRQLGRVGSGLQTVRRAPYGDRAVWIGYDPAETGDTAGLVVVAPPQLPGGKFRLLERIQFRGMDFAKQAAEIERITRRYWVTYIGIDTTGMGSGVAQLVKQFFPNLVTFSYSPEVKTRLVLKAFDVIHNGRLCRLPAIQCQLKLEVCG